MKKLIIGLSAILFLTAQTADAAYTIRNGWLVDADELPSLAVHEHFEIGMNAMEACDYMEAARHFRIVSEHFPTSEFGADAYFNLGVCYFKLEELDFANNAFTGYLKLKNSPKHFLEAVEYKYRIAELFKKGARRRFFGTRQLPKWASGQDMAISIYDEVIAALPTHEIAANALYSKGGLLWSLGEYRDAIDAFQCLIRRFPKHELAPESYLAITRVYKEQSEYEFQNPDILAFAQLNVRKFAQEFPREERIFIAENTVQTIKEIYARGFYETGQFYERTSHARAAIIYYQKAIKQFPDTHIAELCASRLQAICPSALVQLKAYSSPQDANQRALEESAAEEMGVPTNIDFSNA